MTKKPSTLDSRAYGYARVSDLPAAIPEPPTMRKHWWEFWRPKYVWMVQKGDMLVADNVQQGRVIKAKTAPAYEPGQSNKGGRVVRHIPKQLKKMKEAQSEVPTVQD